jgi:hypothetical protein
MRTALFVAGALIAFVALIAFLALRGLRKFVRALWPHS